MKSAGAIYARKAIKMAMEPRLVGLIVGYAADHREAQTPSQPFEFFCRRRHCATSQHVVSAALNF